MFQQIKDKYSTYEYRMSIRRFKKARLIIAILIYSFILLKTGLYATIKNSGYYTIPGLGNLKKEAIVTSSITLSGNGKQTGNGYRIRIEKKAPKIIIFDQTITAKTPTFNYQIPVNAGAGTYTISIINKNTKKRYVLTRHKKEETATAFILPSDQIDSNQESLLDLVSEIKSQLNKECITKKQIMRYLYNWIKNNMTYQRPPVNISTSSQIIKEKKGVCKHLSIALIGLLRVENIPSRMAIKGRHAWVEVYYNQGWKVIDPTLAVYSKQIGKSVGNEVFLGTYKDLVRFYPNLNNNKEIRYRG